ncbi:hypothetical protein AB6A40_009021 [Gnathostoma spinigerum]|uniref:DRBM domain-containing protein n=1 Tax=Gnathostoma spinigerum TaxID=75299 RepID=A0ABD6F002_9BILA
MNNEYESSWCERKPDIGAHRYDESSGYISGVHAFTPRQPYSNEQSTYVESYGAAVKAYYDSNTGTGMTGPNASNYQGQFHPSNVRGTFPSRSLGRGMRGGMPPNPVIPKGRGRPFMSAGSGPVVKKKKYSAEGKTAISVVHELYPECRDKFVFEPVSTDPRVPRFACSVTVNGQTFRAEGTNKKIAKQMVGEEVIKKLRPDLQCNMGFASQIEAKKLANIKRCQAALGSVSAAPKPAKTAKTMEEPAEKATSLVEYFTRMCKVQEKKSGVRYNPVFKITPVVDDGNKKPHEKKFK